MTEKNELYHKKTYLILPYTNIKDAIQTAPEQSLINILVVCSSMSEIKHFGSAGSFVFPCQTVWIQIRSNILSGLIWVQTIFKSYQQTAQVGKTWMNTDHLTRLDNYTYLSILHRINLSGLLTAAVAPVVMPVKILLVYFRD